MRFPSTLIGARLERRYKRFLADVLLADGQAITVHCPNTGAMTGCAPPGAALWLSLSDNSKRKYPHTWELVETAEGIACIHSARANAVVEEALQNGVLSEFSDYPKRRREVKYGDGSRVDFLLEGESGQLYIEVKSVTLCLGEGAGAFPDAVSERGRKHLQAMQAVCESGQRAMLLFCVMHSGIQRVSVAAHIDPQYRAAMAEAMAAGVEVQAWAARISNDEITLDRRLPFSLDGEQQRLC